MEIVFFRHEKIVMMETPLMEMDVIVRVKLRCVEMECLISEKNVTMET